MTSDRAFFGVAALLFVASAALTIVWCGSMPGGGATSMMWMRVPGQTWSGAAASFVCMWIVMMVAMMLPSLLPMLWRYRRVVARTVGGRASGTQMDGARAASMRMGAARIDRLTALVGAGYFFVWAVFGAAAFPLGVALEALEMQHPVLARDVPIAGGVVVLMMGFLQLTAWKARKLACCREEARHGSAREAPGHGLATLAGGAGTAWRHGLSLGLQCSRCCGGLMVILLIVGVMDLYAMAIVTVAITAERLAPGGERVARAVGAVAVGAALFLILRASGVG